MKRYTMYRDIRKEALIMGLPVMLFGVQIVALVLSLFLLIFFFFSGRVISHSAGKYWFVSRFIAVCQPEQERNFFPGLS